MNRFNQIIGILVFSLCFVACKEHSLPKPHGYFRIDVPDQNNYQSLKGDFPYHFEYSEHANIEIVSSAADSFWLDIIYPQLNGRIYLSYKALEHTALDLLTEDARKFAFKHSVKASGIDEAVINDVDRKMYGVFYKIDGDAASNAQFFLTDSSHHFLRAALYFECTPNQDSLAPVINYVREDMMHLLETFEWDN